MGITLRSRRGPVGRTWQGQALQTALEAMLGRAGTSRGKADARAGNVQWIDVAAGRVRGGVRGIDDAEYEASIDLPVFRPGDREAALAILQGHPDLAARLASGELPEAVHEELAAQEVPLLPSGASQLSHDCSCPEWPGPCRHVAALAFVLVEAVDEAPLHLLTLRGLALEDLVAPLGSSAPTGATGLMEPTGSAGHGTPSNSTTPSDTRIPSEPTDPTAPETEADPTPPVGTTHPVGTTETADHAADLPAARFDPTRLRPEPLIPALGPATATALADFFREGRPQHLQ